MIRRDYLLRIVAELTQVLLRIVSLRYRREHEQALQELDQALQRMGDAPPPTSGSAQAELEVWISLCQNQDQEVTAGLMLAVARLWRERGELQALRHELEATGRCRVLALGLLLEAVLAHDAMVSGELLDEIEQLYDQTAAVERPARLLQQLVLYFEARGQFARGEDVLFEWLEMEDPGARAAAVSAGHSFYQRLLALPDADLENGNLPRAEVEAGLNELQQRHSSNRATS